MIQFAASIFGTVGLRLAAPVIALLLLADASLAVLGRVQAQLHLVSLTMPLKLAATMLLMSATLALQPRFLEARMTLLLRVLWRGCCGARDGDRCRADKLKHVPQDG